MPPPAYYIEHGTPIMQIEQETIRDAALEPHRLSVAQSHTSRNEYAPGYIFPDWPRMPVKSRERRKDGPNWIYRLELEGIDGDEDYILLGEDKAVTEEGWDTMQRGIYTDLPNDARWAPLSRKQSVPLTGVAAEADDDTFTKVDHGMVTGQVCTPVFASGFTGITSGTDYVVIRLTDDTFQLATTAANALAGTEINITSDGTGATVTPIDVGYEAMFAVDRQDRITGHGFYEFALSYKGMLNPKAAKRRINTTPQSVSVEGATGTGLFGSYSGWPAAYGGTVGVTYTGDRVSLDLPGVSVTDVMISSDPPPTGLVPGFWVPPDAPSITTWSLTFADPVYHLPHGWKCLNLQSEQIPGKNLWLIAVTWGNQRETTPS